MSETNPEISIEKWFCISCSKFLGFVENKKTVRVKLQDLYIEIEGGKITMPCRGCGKVNILEDIKS